MFSKSPNILLLLSFIGCIYILRNSETTPGTLLRRQLQRSLALVSYTGISQDLCSGIDMVNATSREISNYDSVQKSLNNIRSGNPLVSFIQGDKPKDEFMKSYVVPLVAFSAPWIIMFIIALIGFIVCFINFCCMHCNCCCCKCKCCLAPKDARRKKCYVVLSLFFIPLMAGAAIGGIIFSAGVQTGGRQSLCSVGLFMDKLLLGSDKTYDRWIGLNLMIEDFNLLLNSWQTMTKALTVNYMPLKMQQSVTLAATMTSTTSVPYASLTTMYTAHKDDTISPRPDPAASTTSYQPFYVKNLGPRTTATTNMGLIQAEISEKTARVNDAVDKLFKNVPVLAVAGAVTQFGGVSTWTDILGLMQAKVQNATYTANNLTDNAKLLGDSGKKAFDAIGGGLIGVFAVTLVGGVGAVLAIILVGIGAKFFNKLLYISCFIIGVMMILTSILSAVIFPLSIVLGETCVVVQRAVTEPAFFNQTFDKFMTDPESQSSKDLMYSCLFGDGDAFKAMGIKGYLQPLSDTLFALEETANLSTYGGNTVPDSLAIDLQKFYISGYSSGTQIDSDEVISDLGTLNKYTQSVNNPCTSVQDQWMMNGNNCSQGGDVFASSSAVNYDIGNKVCIGFNVWGKLNDINQRYTSTQFPSSCGNVNNQPELTYVTSFVNNFVTARTSRINVFSSIQNDLNTVASANSAWMNNVKATTATYDSVRDATAPIYSAFYDDNKGVLKNAQCNWVPGTITNIQNKLCTRFSANLFEAAVTIIIMSIVGLIGNLMIFCLAKRFILSSKGGEAAKRI